MKNKVIFAGTGGQGVMSAGILLAQTSSSIGLNATYLPEYGPQQRGGSAKCTVIFGDETINSPLIARCDCLIALNEQSLIKFLPTVRPGGIVVMNTSRISVDADRDDVRIIKVAADDLALELGNAKSANLILLGCLIGATGAITEDDFVKALRAKFARKSEEIILSNVKAFELGEKIAEGK